MQRILNAHRHRGARNNNVAKKKNKTILVVGDRVLIQPDTGEKQSPAGLYLPASVIEKQEVQAGMVVKVGPGIPLGSPSEQFDEPWKESQADVKYIPTQAEVGDYALFLKIVKW